MKRGGPRRLALSVTIRYLFVCSVTQRRVLRFVHVDCDIRTYATFVHCNFVDRYMLCYYLNCLYIITLVCPPRRQKSVSISLGVRQIVVTTLVV